MAEVEQGSTVEQSTGYPEVEIAITSLKLDELNFRHDEVDSQRAAIKAMIVEQRFGLVELAEHYLEYGLMPGERLIVVADDEEEGAYIVSEGNRRLTIMKLMSNPTLAAETEVHARFVELAREFAERRPRATLPCVVLPDKESTLVWVGVKHNIGMGGAGVNQWKSPATSRFNEYVTGKVTRWRAALRFLREQGVDADVITEAIKRKTTAVNRVLNSGAMRSVLGVRFSQDGQIEFDSGDVTAGTRLLEAMMRRMAQPGFSTNLVHSFDDRLDFIEEFAELTVNANAAGGGAGGTQANERNGGGASGRGPGSGSNSQDGSVSGGGTGRSATQSGSPAAGTGNSGGTHSDGSEADDNGAVGVGNETRRGVRRPPGQRSKLASTRRGDELRIPNDRRNQIYHEARRLNVERHTAVAAVIIRVFVELSCEFYLTEKAVPVPEAITRRNGGRQTSWHTFGVKFREKIEAVLAHLDPKGVIQELGDIRRGLGSQDHLTSPENLHDYVHGLKTIPAARDLVIIWDRYHQLFTRMFV